MELSGYRVEILGGRHFNKDFDDNYSHTRFPWKPDINGDNGDYVELDHNQHYRIRLSNNHRTRCQAKVSVDNKYMGTWIIDSYDNIVIERPASIDKKFIFYRARSAPRGANISMGDSNNGLVQVDFTPEEEHLDYYTPKYLDGSFSCFNNQSFDGHKSNSMAYHKDNEMALSYGIRNYEHEGGATALKGRSGQKFRRVGPMSLNKSSRVTISVRLVANKYTNSYYNEVTPLTSVTSNPVPPPIY